MIRIDAESWIESLPDTGKDDAKYVTAHNAESGPHLPHHHQRTSDIFWRSFSSVNWNCSTFGPNSKTESEPREKKLPPGLRECLKKTCERAN